MQRKAKVAIILVIIMVPLIGVFLYFTPNALKKGISGVLLTDTTWSGDVYISGDVVVLPWVTLTVLPGTTIKVSAISADFSIDRADSNPDNWNTGDPVFDANAGGTDYVKSHNSIIVLGKIICKGTAEQPIRIISDAANPTYTDWNGMSIKSGEFEYTEIAHCLVAAYSDSEFESLTVSNCYFHTLYATGVGFRNPANNASQAYVKNCTFRDIGHEAIDTHSSGNLKIAYNYVEKCQVGINMRNDLEIENRQMNAQIHHNVIVDCNVPILVAKDTNIFITQVVVNAKQQNAGRWNYSGHTLYQMENPTCIFIEPNATGRLIITNSIFFDSNKGIVCDNLNTAFVFQSGYHCFENITTQATAGLNVGAGIITSSAQFVNKITGDFHLQVTSPCIGAGNPIESPAPDLGAYGGNKSQSVLGWSPSN